MEPRSEKNGPNCKDKTAKVGKLCIASSVLLVYFVEAHDFIAFVIKRNMLNRIIRKTRQVRDDKGRA